MFHVKHSFLFPILIYIRKEENDEDPPILFFMEDKNVSRETIDGWKL